MSAQHLTNIEIQSIAHRLETLRDRERDPISRQALTHAARLVRAMPVVIQCGDTLCQEVDVDAQAAHEADPDGGLAIALRAFCDAWRDTVKPYREE